MNNCGKIGCRLNNVAARENSILQSFKFFRISCTAPEMEIIPKLFYARREFKKSFQTEICAAVLEQSFHAIVDLFTCQRNKSNLQFWRQKFEFLLSIVLHFNRVTFKTKICAFVQNWWDFVCRDTDLQEPNLFIYYHASIANKLTENCEGLWLEGVTVIWWHSERFQN